MVGVDRRRDLRGLGKRPDACVMLEPSLAKPAKAGIANRRLAAAVG